MLTAARLPARWMALAVLTALLTCMPLATATSTATAATTAATTDACGSRIAKPGGGQWTCSFVDDFAGSKLDSTRWTSQDTSRTGFYMGTTCFKPGQGYAVGGGSLKLTVRRTAWTSCATPSGSVQTNAVGADLNTWGKFSQVRGRFEARLKFPSYTGAGLHGGFWMNPYQNTYGAWPASGEIDVAEWYSNVADHMYPSLHYSGSDVSRDTAWNCVIGRADVFHTYAVEWGQTSMTFLYDGKACFTRSWAPTGMSAPAPFDRGFTLDVMSGLGVGGNAPTSATPSTTVTYVDYVKAWR